MPTPTRTDLHPVSIPLSNYTVAAMQDEEDFVLRGITGQRVEIRTGRYFTYTTGAWNRAEMQPRASGEESVGSGWALSNDTYDMNKFAVHHDNDWDDIGDEPDTVSLEEDAGEWLANQISLKGDILLVPFWAGGVWTTDYDGVAASPSTSEFLQWNDSSSDPQATIEVLKSAVRALIAKMPNTLWVGEDVHTTLLTHPILRDSVKHTGRTDSNVMRDAIKSWLGVDDYKVARGQYNSAAEGQTVSMGPILDADDFLLAYQNPEEGKKKMAAIKPFYWKGPRGEAVDGVVGRTFDIIEREVTRHEVDFYVDVKQVAADAGAFGDEAVA